MIEICEVRRDVFLTGRSEQRKSVFGRPVSVLILLLFI